MLAFPALACEAPETKPSLRVDVEIDTPGIDHAHSRDALKQFNISTASPYAHGSAVHVNGVMRGSISVETKSMLAWQRTSDGKENCFWYDRVNLLLKLDPTIYVAQEIPQGSCLYREVLAHEYKHYSVDYAIAKDYQVLFQDELERFLQQTPFVGPFPENEKQQAQDMLAKQLEARIKVIHERLNTERINRQGAVDSLAEYERVAQACPQQSGYNRHINR